MVTTSGGGKARLVRPFTTKRIGQTLPLAHVHYIEVEVVMLCKRIKAGC
jgi:hypothetical protein